MSERRPTMPCNTAVSVISIWHGKFYASGVALSGDEFVSIGIMGPYDTRREAEKWAAQWIKDTEKAMKNGETVHLPDVTSVPADVRAYITTDVKAALRERGLKGLTDQHSVGC